MSVLIRLLITYKYVYEAFVGKFDCVLKQVENDLVEARLIEEDVVRHIAVDHKIKGEVFLFYIKFHQI